MTRRNRALPRLSLFTQLNLEQFKTLLSRCETRALRPGEILLKKDQLNECMYVVIDGQLTVQTEETEDAMVALNAGQTLGEMSIIGTQKVKASVKAAAPSRVVVISKDKLWQLMDTDPEFARTLVHMFAMRLFNVTNVSPYDHHFHRPLRSDLHLDELTGLYKSQWLSECVADEMSRCGMRNRPLSMLAIAIDQIESEYESQREGVATPALKAVSNAVQIALRALDMAFLYSHAKIIVLLPGANIFEGERLANRLHQAVQHITITSQQGRSPGDITISVGIAEMAEDEYAEIFVARATAALQRATRSGGNRTSQ